MMPTSHTSNKKKLLSSSWWREKLFNHSNKKQKSRAIKTNTTTQNWRNLSPDEPPLPFLLNNKSTIPSIKFLSSSSEADKYSSELAPIFLKDASSSTTTKDLDYFPSPSLYISQPSSSSRELYTIPELSEMNTTTTSGTNSTRNNTINSSRSGISSTSAAPPPLPTSTTLMTTSEEELQRNVTHGSNNGEDLFVSPPSQQPLPQPSSSSSISLTITPVAQVQEQQPEIHDITTQQKPHQSMILVEDEDDEEEEEEEGTFKPISEWPSLDIERCKEPQFRQALQGNEQECKVIFSHMLQSAYKYHQLYYSKDKKNATTKEMHLIFDEKDNIGGITFILENGMREDYLQFGGTPQYIPPELSTCATYNHELADVWALGISLYRMLVGKYPFTSSGNHKELFKKMLHSDFRIPNSLSDDAKDLLRRMLAPESTRASLDLILFHPWIKSYIQSSQQEDTPPPVIEEKKNKKKNKKRKRDRVLRVVKKAIRLVFLGPYPPPKRDDYYHYYTQQKRRQQQQS